MELYKSSVINRPKDEVFKFCTSKNGFIKHFPHKIKWLSGPEIWTSAHIVLHFKFYIACLPINYKTEIIEFEKDNLFVDVMRCGPYKYFLHEHHFQEISEGTLYTDKLSFSLGLSKIIDSIIARPITNFIFTRRHHLLVKNLNECPKR